MKNITKKDVLIGAIIVFIFYKLNGVKFNVSGKTADCGCGGHA